MASPRELRVALLPVSVIAVGLVLAVAMPELDRVLDINLGLERASDSARAALGAMASGMIAFTGFVFSAVVLVVQFGSTAFSPRLLRVLRADIVPRLALGVFTATFLYALVLTQNIADDFEPTLSLLTALFLLLSSVAVLLLLLYRLTDALRATAVIRQVGVRGRRVIRATYPDPFSESEPDRLPVEPSDSPTESIVHQGPSAYLLAIDRQAVAEIARRADARILLAISVGDYVYEGRTLFEVFGREPVARDELLAAAPLGDERTVDLDPPFAFRLLVDIANKALSPAVNDPTTAVQAIDQIEELLSLLATRRLGVGVVGDAEGVPRFAYPTPLWGDYLALSVDEIRRYGRGSIQITRRLRALLDDLHTTGPESRRPAIEDRLHRLEADIHEEFSQPGDRLEALMPDRQGIGSPEAMRGGFSP